MWILAKIRSQEKGVLAKGVSTESSVTRKETINIQRYWAQPYIWHSERHSQERRTFCTNPLLKTPFSWFLTKIRARQRSGEGVVRRNGCPKGVFWRVRFFSAPLKHLKTLRGQIRNGLSKKPLLDNHFSARRLRRSFSQRAPNVHQQTCTSR